MGISTDIQWADSTLNLMMGCDGCELWNPKAGVKECYAGVQIDRYDGSSKGYPASFDKPALFLHRLSEAEKWKLVAANDRYEKPWMDGLPRTIFLNDMGDTFTESLPLDWLAPLLPRMAAMPVIWMLLTKRTNRMLEFSRMYEFPSNFWLMTTVTSAANYNRIEQLMECRGGSIRGISYEPAIGPLELSRWLPKSAGEQGLNWVIGGGMSGVASRNSDIEWFLSARDQCAGRAAYFQKQLGKTPLTRRMGTLHDTHFPKNPRFDYLGDNLSLVRLSDRKGGDPEEWPTGLRLREMPLPWQI